MKKKHNLWFKLLIVFLSVVFLMVISVGGWFFWVTGSLNTVHKSEELKMGAGTKQALIIYQPSKNDTTSNVTLELAKQLAAEDYTVTINYPSENLHYDFEQYDIIAFGSPVYMGKLSSTLEDYIKSLSIRNKIILLYVTGMNTEDTGELTKMANWLDSVNLIDAIKLGKADPEQISWFLTQCTPSWNNHYLNQQNFTIHSPSQWGMDATSGATMN